MATTYRDSKKKVRVANSSDEDTLSSGEEDSDETNAVWSSKRSRPTAPGPDCLQTIFSSNGHDNGVKAKRSRNVNIWGAVLAEQCSNDISSSLGAVGMQRHIARGPESFDLPADIKVSDSDSSSDEEHLEIEQKIVNDKMKTNVAKCANQSKEAVVNKRKRKAGKNKNKNNIPCYKPGQKVTLNKRCDLSDTDPVDKVSEEIAFRLWERKRDLVRSLVETLGVPLAIDLYNKAEGIEKSGGLLTLQGTRRRTPGGTFIHLIRNDPRVDQEPINKVFSLESERDKMLWEQRKHRKVKKAERTIPTELNVDTSCGAVDASTQGMDCNDGVASEQAASLITSLQNPQNGASKSNNTGSNNPADAELSEGEIIDSDDDNNGQPDPFG